MPDSNWLDALEENCIATALSRINTCVLHLRPGVVRNLKTGDAGVGHAENRAWPRDSSSEAAIGTMLPL
jgi:hypothetical protein